MIMSWLAPASGTVDLSMVVEGLDTGGGDGIAFYLNRGDAAGNLGSGLGAWNLFDKAVAAGEHINFVVDPLGDFIFDSARLFAEVAASTVPLPTAGLLLGPLLLAWRPKRRPELRR